MVTPPGDDRGSSHAQTPAGSTHDVPGTIRITSQQHMQEANKRVGFCYLCGDPLGDKRRCATEHIVPRGLLGSVSDDIPFPAVLRVHKVCDAFKKAPTDDLAIKMHRVFTNKTHVRELRSLKFGLARVEVAPGEYAPAFTNAEGALKAPSIWIRGFHSLLFAEFMQPTHMCALPPVPAFSGNNGLNFPQAEQYSGAVRGLLARRILSNEYSGVTAWAGTLRYWCVWFVSSEIPDAHFCVWALSFNGVVEWSQSVVGDAIRPYHGMYITRKRPNGVEPIRVERGALTNS